MRGCGVCDQAWRGVSHDVPDRVELVGRGRKSDFSARESRRVREMSEIHRAATYYLYQGYR